MTQVKIMPILNVSGCPLESRLPSVEGWPFEDDAAIWRQPNRSLVEAVELLGGKLDRPGAWVRVMIRVRVRVTLGYPRVRVTLTLTLTLTRPGASSSWVSATRVSPGGARVCVGRC